MFGELSKLTDEKLTEFVGYYIKCLQEMLESKP